MEGIIREFYPAGDSFHLLVEDPNTGESHEFSLPFSYGERLMDEEGIDLEGRVVHIQETENGDYLVTFREE